MSSTSLRDYWFHVTHCLGLKRLFDLRNDDGTMKRTAKEVSHVLEFFGAQVSNNVCLPVIFMFPTVQYSTVQVFRYLASLSVSIAE